MRRIVLRVYAALVAAVLLALVVVAVSQRAGRQRLTSPEDVVAAIEAATTRYPDDPDAALDAVQRAVGGDVRRPRAVAHRGAVEVAGWEVHAVASGAVLPDGRTLGMLPGPPRALAWVVFVALCALAVAITASLRPLRAQLGDVERAARQLAAGRRDARAPIVEGSPTEDLARALNGMADELVGAVDDREQLLAAVAHELRTPLTRLRFAVELLAAEPDAAARDARSAALERDLDELEGLVGDLLAWGRTGADVERVQVDLAGVLELARRAATATCPEAVVDVIGDGTVTADPAGLRRAVCNLAVNAVRHGGRHVRLEASAWPDVVEVTVDDDGPGIPATARRRVLEPFAVVDPSRASGGAGLGLALVARFADAHHGAVHIDDSPLGGARVVLRLPVGPA